MTFTGTPLRPGDGLAPPFRGPQLRQPEPSRQLLPLAPTTRRRLVKRTPDVHWPGAIRSTVTQNTITAATVYTGADATASAEIKTYGVCWR